MITPRPPCPAHHALAAVALLPCLALACYEVGANGFLASADDGCPSGFVVSEGRCYRGSAPRRGDAGTAAAADARGAEGPGSMAGAEGPDAGATGTRDGGADPRDTGGGGDAAAGEAAAACPSGNCLVATAIAVGGLHTCALLPAGTVQCWGSNGGGALGVPQSLRMSPRPVAVPGLRGVTALSAGDEFTCALVAGGAVYCWGEGRSGQLGDGSPAGTIRPAPMPVTGLQGMTAIGSGSSHSCAVHASGEVSCWGENAFGQLGDGNSGEAATRLSPYRLSFLSNAVALAAGGGHTCALARNGTAVCWGRNGSGQLGVPQSILGATPVMVTGLAGATALSAGSNHTCAVAAGGAIRCWGSNFMGLLGDGSALPFSYQHVGVAGLGAAVAVAAGDRHTCAALADGVVRCWGQQRSNGTAADSPVPVALAGLAGATAIDTGSTHSCAIAAGGFVQCWGYNGNGQLGRGTYDSLPLGPSPPVQLAP